MRLVFSCLIAVLCLQCASLEAQNGGDDQIDSRAKSIRKKGQRYLYERNFERAKRLFKKAIGKDSAFKKAYMNLAGVYYQMKEYDKRDKVLKMVIKKFPDFKDPYYNLGSNYYVNEEYKKAAKYYKKFLNFDNLQEKYRNKAKNRLEKARFRARQMANPFDYNAKNVGPGVNTKRNEYWPVLTIDRQTLYFTRELKKSKKKRDRRRGRRNRFKQSNEDIFKSNLGDNGNWQEAQKLHGNLNSQQNNEGAIAISPDGSYIIFTGCHWSDSKGRCDLYKSTKVNNKWTEPQNLGAPINTKHKETQPSIAFDGNTLYFASNKGNKRGNLDIFRSKRKANGEWGEPERLSDNINTDKAEQSPFIHSDNKTLYFASKGHKGMGELDLFYSKRDSANGKFQKPKNLGYPINDKDNELGVFVSSDGKTALYASEKEKGQGGLDIYQFTLPEKARADKVTYLKGKIEDAVTHQNLKANVKLKNLESGKVVVRKKSGKNSGEFMVPLHSDKNYGVTISKDGYIFHSEHIPIRSYDSAKPFHLDVMLQPIQEGGKTTLDNIFFELDSHELKPTSKPDLQELIQFLGANPRVSIQIRGHTDKQGSKSYNQTLSRKRAQSVSQYLLDKGDISKDRIDYKGFGESKPIATNKTEEGRAKNRRTEFKIIDVKAQ